MTNTMTDDTTQTTLLLLFWRECVAKLRQIATNDSPEPAILSLDISQEQWDDEMAKQKQLGFEEKEWRGVAVVDTPEPNGIFYTAQRIERIERVIDWMGSEENAHILPTTPKFGEAMRLMPKLCFLALHGDSDGFDKFVADNEPFPIQG